jgi:uncharacterized membrane protein HdeD (DUF308 family)
MNNPLALTRWLIGLRGVLAIIFGVLAFIWPGLTALVLVFMFGIYAVFDGVLTLASAFRARASNPRWWLGVLEGIVSIAAGLIAFIWPAQTAVALVFVIAAWAILTGILEIAAAIRLRDEIKGKGEWAIALTGVVSIILGVVLLINPGNSILALTWVIASYAIIFGLLMIYLAITARSQIDRGGGQTVPDR